MHLKRLVRLAGLGLLVGLLALAHVQQVQALFGVLWRTPVLAWSDPATQPVEDLSSPAGSQGEMGQPGPPHVIAPPKHADLLPDQPSRAPGLALSQGITRSPPAA